MHRARTIACFIAVTTALLGAVSGCSGEDGRPTTGPTGPGSGTGTGTGTGTGGKGGETNSEATTGDTSATEPGDEAAESTEKKGAAEGPCADGSECESGVCFVGTNQSYCSVKCTAASAATDCVAPFTGSCNKQGYCKRD